MRIVCWAFGIVMILFSIACIEIGLDPAFPKVDPQWSGPVTRIPFPQKYYSDSNFEFSADSQLVCLFHEPDYLNKNTFKRNVFDLKGNPVKDAINKDQSFTPQYRNMFRLAIPMASDGIGDRVQVESYWRYQAQHTGPAQSPEQEVMLSITFKWRDLPCLDLLLKTNAWCLSDDFSEVLCLRPPTDEYDGCKTVECWGLTPKQQKKWSITLKNGIFGSWENAGFFEKDGKRFITIDTKNECLILAETDGQIVGKVDHAEEDPENHKDGTGSYHSAMEPKQRLLAATSARQLRMYSLDPPYKLLQRIKLPAPYAGDKAAWRISRVQFAGDKYLIVDYWRGYSRGVAIRWQHSAGAYKEDHATVIYDLQTGKPAWQNYSNNISAFNRFSVQHVKLSPDGKKMAIKKDKILEIGDFVPQPATALETATTH